MTKPIKNKEWENELSRLFLQIVGYDNASNYDFEKLKSFISTLLKAQKQEIIKEVIEKAEKMKKINQFEETVVSSPTGFELAQTDYSLWNHALSDLIEKLKEMEEGR